jgi:SAM-dependent methyltransferase
MSAVETDILRTVSEYYTDKISTHGATPRGVDWNDPESQALRFEQLAYLLPPDRDQPFSLLDLGCGYGALYDHLAPRYRGMSYLGLDISDAMVDQARNRHAGSPNARFESGAHPSETLDFAVASGIFNVRQHYDDATWRDFIFETIAMMDAVTRHGFAFNCLTSFSDSHYMQDRLYYADPCEIFRHCKERFSRNVALLHDYQLFEFTIVVRKSDAP